MPTKPDKKQSHQSDGSGGKSSNPHTNLTKHHTCRANFLLARHNTQPLVALNLFLCVKKKFTNKSNDFLMSENLLT